MANFFTRTLGSLAAKLNPAWASFSSYSDTPMAIHMSRDFKTYAKEGYKNSDTLYKCISYLIRNGAAIPPVLYKSRDNLTKNNQIKSHPLLDKLNKPNNEQTGVQYRESVLGYKLLAGNSFQYAIRAKNAPPDELWVLRPDRMEIMIVAQKGIVGYRYDGTQPIDPGLVGHMKYWNPDDDNEQGMGMSPVTAAALNIDMQIAGKKWNLGLLQNGARPPGIWRIPVLMGRNERQKLEDKLNEKFGGPRGAGKSPLFDGGLDWKPTGLAPAQMDYLDSLKYNGGSIANILNMAPQLVGDTSSSTYDNMEQAKVWSYTEGIFPELDDLYALWQNWLVPMYPDLVQSGAFLYYDKESVEVIQKLIQAQKDAQEARAKDLWMSGLAMQNEARALAGLPPTGEGNVWRIGGILVPQGKLQEYAEQSLTTPAAPPPALPEPIQLPASGAPGPAPTSAQKPGEPEPDQEQEQEKQPPKSARPGRAVKALDLQTAEQKQAYLASVEAQRERWYGKATQRLHDYFAGEKAAVTEAISHAALPASAEVRAEYALNQQFDNLKAVLVKLYQDIGLDVGKETLKQLKAGLRPHERKDAVQDFIDLLGHETLVYLLQMAALKVKDISETTRAQIQSALSDGVAAGESIPQLVKRIDDLYVIQTPSRIENIARTEVVGASNWSSHEAAKQSGLTLLKVYLATDDDRTRPDHADADGQKVAMDEPFEVGGYKMMYPGDSSLGAPASEICRCRCTQFYERAPVEGEEDTEDTEDTETEEKRRTRRGRHPLTARRKQRNAYRRFMEATL